MPFGEYRGTAPTTNAPLDTTFMSDLGYTGHQHNNDLGLVYMNARFYVPGVGKFASADTIIPAPTNPQSYNRYAYVLNNPLNFIDPSGHFSEKAIQAYIWQDCQGKSDCYHSTYDQWRSDQEWWAMLRAAKPGDQIFGEHCYGRCNEFQSVFEGKGQDELTGIRSSKAYCNTKLCTYPRWKQTNLSLKEIQKGFDDDRYVPGAGGKVIWGGLFVSGNKGGIVDVLIRMSQVTVYKPGFDWSESVLVQVPVGLAVGLCPLAGVGGVAACALGEYIAGEVADSIDYGFPSGEDQLWVVAGHVFSWKALDHNFGSLPRHIVSSRNSYWGYRRYDYPHLYYQPEFSFIVDG